MGLMIHLNNDQKLQVLITELQERYNASHKIRERSMQFTLWISGMAIGLGWLLIGQKTLVLTQKIALSLLIAALFAVTFYFIMGLRKGFQKNRGTMIKCEHALRMHDSDVYLTDTPLLPDEYNSTNRKWNDHFCTLCVWLLVVTISLLILTWTNPDQEKVHSINTKIEKINGGQKNG